MELIYFQRGFNFSQDGPGNRLVYHLSGCNLTCPWCANPEGMQCGKGTAVDNATLMREILSARPMFFDHGGVTFTGGEPTLQFEALKEILCELQVMDVNTCIETNGTSPRLPELFPCLSSIIIDFKHPEARTHCRWTGHENSRIRENIFAASRTDLPLQLRVPLIHGVNDDDEALHGFIVFFKSVMRENVTVEFLPYHEYGKSKWFDLGLEYAMQDAYVANERVCYFEEQCAANGVTIIHT